MKVNISQVKDSYFSLVFLHGWGVDEKSLECIKKLFETKYDCYLITLSGFDKPLSKPYTIEDYIFEINSYICKLKNVVIIGHSFGGKIALMLKRLYPKYIVIALAPSIIKNPFSFKIFFKIRLYKILKKISLPIPNFLKGSKDYRKLSGNLKKTFLLVHHSYLNKKQLKELEKCLIIVFKQDKEVNHKKIKKLSKINSKIVLLSFEGNHFAYLDSLLDIYHNIYGFLKEQYE